jgi:tetratricopeptide (TPR) repeat protein
MYRRNISSVLYPIAAVLGLFIVYQAVVKPTYLVSPPPPQTEQESATDSKVTASMPPVEPSNDDSQTPPQKQLRVIDAGGVPETKHRGSLETIRDEIEKGNLKEAEAGLNALPSPLPGNTRPYTAILWNNLGIEQEKLEGTKGSLKTFKKAASLDPNNPVIQMNLAHACWEQRDPAMTQEFLERLIVLAPQEPFPHVALAELLQERGRLSEAAQHLDQAAARAGIDPSVQSYLQNVTAKVRRTDQMESRLTSRYGDHFTVKYDGEADHGTWRIVLDVLEDAYREIGQKLGHFPSKPIVVVLHPNATFQSNTGSPAWADGLFDPVLGRIHVPTQNALADQAWLKRVLRHEFVHALLHDQQGLNHQSIPTWLNEGLAMQLSSDHWTDVEQLHQQKLSVIPLTNLEGSWAGLSTEEASLAYLEADSATRYLIHRYGMHEVQQLMARLKKKQSLAAAIHAQLSLSYDQFQSRWVAQLQEGRTKG